MASLLAPLVRRFGTGYDDDVSHLETMDRQAPGTLWRWLLALAIAFGGLYPTLKRGLGAASSCAPVLAELQAAS